MAKTQSQQKQCNNKADTLNTNKGTSGSNPINASVNGNRGKQLNPNQKKQLWPLCNTEGVSRAIK